MEKDLRDRLDSIDSSLLRIEKYLNAFGGNTPHNFETLEKLIEKKIDEAKREILKKIEFISR